MKLKITNHNIVINLLFVVCLVVSIATYSIYQKYRIEDTSLDKLKYLSANIVNILNNDFQRVISFLKTLDHELKTTNTLNSNNLSNLLKAYEGKLVEGSKIFKNVKLELKVNESKMLENSLSVYVDDLSFMHLEENNGNISTSAIFDLSIVREIVSSLLGNDEIEFCLSTKNSDLLCSKNIHNSITYKSDVIEDSIQLKIWYNSMDRLYYTSIMPTVIFIILNSLLLYTLFILYDNYFKKIHYNEIKKLMKLMDKGEIFKYIKLLYIP